MSFIVCTLPHIIKAITSNRVMRWKELVETENCALLGYYAASSGNFLPTFREKPIGSNFKDQGSRSHLQWPRIEIFGFLDVEDGTDRLSRKVGKKLSHLAA
jgi:hypothetical protein